MEWECAIDKSGTHSRMNAAVSSIRFRLNVAAAMGVIGWEARGGLETD